MKITIDNYEIFFIDYFDGNLTENQKQELFSFLEKHPSLKKEFENFEEYTLVPKEKISFNRKNELKEISENGKFNYTDLENLSIASIENDISETEKIKLNNIINNNPAAKKEFELLTKTKLIADKTIKFKYKNRIKRNIIPISIIRTAISSAAAVLIFTVIFTQIFNKPQNNSGNSSSFADINISPKTAITYTHSTNTNNEKVQVNTANNTNKNKQINNLGNSENSLQTKNLNKIHDINAKIIQQRIFSSELAGVEKIQAITAKPGKIEDQKKTFSLWQIAEAGVKTWNTVTSSDVQMNNNYNEQGNIEDFSINYKKIKISKTFNKNK